MPERSRSQTDWLLLLGFCAFLFFWGLNYFGLIGADEPRYAQVAREMLARHDWVKPVLGGKPWLEKPPLYYWQAMIAFGIFGVSDWAARLPSAVDATLMVIAVYAFLRRFRPGFALDGALMTASTAAVIGFARAAATDMPLAASFTIGMMTWMAWYESRKRIYLAGFYVFIALGALAKGPVAPVLAAAIIVIFALLTADAKTLWRTLWIPGIVLFCVVALPWYIAVQLRNPDFFRIFILRHNLARFGTNLYQHAQPIWYYGPVVLLALVPWTILVADAIVEGVRLWWSERHTIAHSEGALNAFLLIWLFLPVLFFSISQSKLPGYILPAIPAGTLLLVQYVRGHVNDSLRPPAFALVLHSLIAAAPIVLAMDVPFFIAYHQFVWNPLTMVGVLIAILLAVGTVATLLSSLGLRMLRFVTLIPVVLSVAAILKVGALTVDERLTARPLSKEIERVEQGLLKTAVFHIPRETEYGLAFYRNQKIFSYDRGEIPSQPHLLVTAEGELAHLPSSIHARRVSLLGVYPPQHVEYYWVSAGGTQ
ncbi:MAG TPA: glycosyltransferase family 39 protein [Terriglobales bacterium]|nr:glycosyltransferase family 39 protein [Terriglobales bacterium]